MVFFVFKFYFTRTTQITSLIFWGIHFGYIAAAICFIYGQALA